VTVERQISARGPVGTAGDTLARLMLVALCLLWGVTWPAMKIALIEIPPLSMRTLTAAAGGLTLLTVSVAWFAGLQKEDGSQVAVSLTAK